MESGGDSLERHSALCNYSHWQTLKNDPGLILTPRKETSPPTAQAASGRPIIALSLLPLARIPGSQDARGLCGHTLLLAEADSLLWKVGWTEVVPVAETGV